MYKFLYTFIFCIVLMNNTAIAAVVLIYHHVSNTTPQSTSISPESFIAHLDYLETNQFNVVPLVNLVELIRQNKPLPDKTVAITFDDSYRDVYASAYPILKKRNWPFTFFVNTDSVGKGKLFVTWDQLREMSKNGVTIANHSTSHNHMVRQNTDESLREWKNRVEKEITLAQEKIEQEIGWAPQIFAYPYGEYNADLKSILEKLGYISFTQQAGALSLVSDRQILPRFPFGGSYTRLDDFALKVNSVALPVTKVIFYSEDNKQLANNSVKEGDQPYFEVQLAEDSLLSKVSCFLNGKPMVIQVESSTLKIEFQSPIEQGRTKITCTAPSGTKGRYYWFTQLWLATDKQGQCGNTQNSR